MKNLVQSFTEFKLVTFNLYNLLNRDLNRGCLVYMFFLRFLGSKFLVNLRLQFRERKVFCTQVFIGFAVFSFCV